MRRATATRDENDGTGSTYNVVTKTWTGTIPPTKGPQADSVVAWGAKYYEATPSADCTHPGLQVDGRHGRLRPDRLDRRRHRAQRLGKSVTNNFARAYINRPGTPLHEARGVGGGAEQSRRTSPTPSRAAARGCRSCGPLSAYKAFVGEPVAPDQFLAIVNVFGPTELGEPSVEGLDVSDFQAWVGDGGRRPTWRRSSPAATCRGRYWLVIQAPDQAGRGRLPAADQAGHAERRHEGRRGALCQAGAEPGDRDRRVGQHERTGGQHEARCGEECGPAVRGCGAELERQARRGRGSAATGSSRTTTPHVIHTLQDVTGQRATAKNAINALTTAEPDLDRRRAEEGAGRARRRTARRWGRTTSSC